MYGLSIVTPPAEEPIDTDEAKAHLRVTGSDDDTYIETLIVSARQWIEQELYRQLVTATWDLVMDEFPSGLAPIRIPGAPLVSVTSISYTDAAGDAQSWSADEYVVSTSREPGEIRPAYGQLYPNTRNAPDVVTVRFVAGYGEAEDVPKLLKSALKLIIGSLYEFREDQVERAISRLPMGTERILAMYDLGDELLDYGAVRINE